MGVISRHDTRKQYRKQKGNGKKINEFETNIKKRNVLGILKMYTINWDKLSICNSLASYKIFTERSVKITSGNMCHQRLLTTFQRHLPPHSGYKFPRFFPFPTRFLT
jgi:hypothetical protein